MIDRKIGDKPINFEVTIGTTLTCSSSTAPEITTLDQEPRQGIIRNMFSLCQVTMETRSMGLQYRRRKGKRRMEMRMRKKRN